MLSALSPVSLAYAACTTPTGNAGDVIFSSASAQMAYCNGTNWIGMGSSSGISFGMLTTGDFCQATGSASIACTAAAINLSSQVSGTLQAAQFPALTGDVTNSAGSLATTVGAIGGKAISLGGAFTTSGAFPLTFITTGTTSLTLPTSGTLLSTASSIGTSQISGILPVANGGTNIGTQTSNGVNYFNGTAITSGAGFVYAGGDVGIGTTGPSYLLDVGNFTTAVANTIRITDPTGYDSSLMLKEASDTYGFTIKNSNGSTGLDGLNILRHSNSAAGTTALFIGRDTGNVGIGTTNPVGTFHIHASTNQNVNFVLNTNGYFTGAPGIVSLNDANTGYDPLGFLASSFDFSGGSVGIGSTIPAATLDVAGYIHASGSTSPSVSVAQGAYLSWNGMTGSTGETDIINNKGGGVGGFAFMNNTALSAPLMFISSGGNVGIGTTNPQSELQVGTLAGDAVGGVPVLDVLGNIQSATSQTMLRLNRPTNGGSYYSGGVDFNVYSYGAAGSPYNPATQLDIVLKSSASATDTANVTVMSLRDNGNVGIGTTGPQFELTNSAQTNVIGGFSGLGASGHTFVWEHPASDAATGYGAAFLNSTASGGGNGLLLKTADATSATEILEAYSGSSTKFLVRADGNVGIGTTSPSGKLDVEGSGGVLLNAGYVAIGTNYAAYPIDLYAGTNSVLNIRSDPTTFGFPSGLLGPILQGVNGAQNTVEPLTLSGSTINLMPVSGTGVGIGTTGPVLPLNVYGAANSPTTSGSTQNGITFVEGSGANGLFTGVLSSSPYSVWMQSGYSIPSTGAWYPISLNPLGGNVGIGTTGPTDLLELHSGSQYAGLKISNASNQVAALGGLSATNDTGFLQLSSGGTITVQIVAGLQGAGWYTYFNGGNVGIGTSGPRTALDTWTGTMSGAPNDYEKAQFVMSGGGTVSWIGNVLKWSNRFIALPMSGVTSTAGYIDIVMPTSGTIPASQVYTGTARSWSASGIVLNGWEALYAVHTPGGNNTSITYYITAYPTAYNVASNWVLVAVANADDGSLKLGTGVTLAAGATYSATGSGGQYVNLQTASPGTQQTGNMNISGNGIFGGNVGIGTTNPVDPLEVYSGVNNTGIFAISGHSGSQGQVGVWDTTAGSVGAYLYSGAGGNAGIATVNNAGTYSGNPVNFTSGGNSIFNGNVGIGTATVGAQLNVYGASSTTQPALSVGDSDGNFDNGATYGMVNLAHPADTTKAHLAFIRNGSFVWQMGYVSGTNTFGIFPWNFSGTQGTPTMAFSGTSVGIGTTSPADTLDVYGTGIHIQSGVPASTSMALYNNAGTLTWNGAALNGATFSGLTTGDFCTATSGTAIGCSTASTGTGSVVLSASPTLTGTVTTAALSVNGVASFANGMTFGGGSINVGGDSRATLVSLFPNLNTGGYAAFAWNYTSGGGETDLFINEDGGNVGGLNIYNFPDTSGNPSAIFTLTGTGNLVIPGTEAVSGGNVTLNNGTSNTIFIGAAGVAVPGNGSVGEKIQLYGTAGTVSASDFALGIASSTMWFNIPSGSQYQWFTNGSAVATLSSTGALTDTGEVVNGTATFNGLTYDAGVLEFPENVWMYAPGGVNRNLFIGAADMYFELGGNDSFHFRNSSDADVATISYTGALGVTSETINGGGITLTAANPSMTSGGSYIIVPNSFYISTATTPFYTEANIRARGGISDDTAAYLTISGGTSGYTYVNGSLGIGSTTPGTALVVNGTMTATTEILTSDRRLKTDIAPLVVDGLQVISQLKPVTFKWKTPRDFATEGVQIGFIAQDVETVLPQVVATMKDKDQTKSLKYESFIPVIVKAIQELKSLFATDHDAIVKLQAANDNQAKAIDDLRGMIARQAHDFEAYKKAHP